MVYNAVGLRLGVACASTIASAWASCRVAVCFSGAIRSFVHPAVHNSIKVNLIEAIEADGCEVDVFAYVTRKDKVGRGKLENSEFTPNVSAIKTALAVLAPTRLIWHQEQSGIIPSSCPLATAPSDGGGHGRVPDYWDLSTWQLLKPDASNGLYWQLYKSRASYRMALREEERQGADFSYDWILRARLDVAWVRPLPPLRAFSRQSVWLNRHFWPMSDHFAMVPRAFSDRFFAALSAFYACDGQSWPPAEPWWQPRCSGGFFEETVQFRYLHAAGIPYRTYFMFEYVITRGALGGWCILGESTFGEACQLLALAGEFEPPFTGHDCSSILAEWVDLRCRALLPADGMGDSLRSDVLTSASDARDWERLAETSAPKPPPPPPVAAGAAVAEAAGAQAGRGDLIVGGETPVDATTLPPTTVPTIDDVDRVRSKLVLLRDSMLGPVRQRQAEGGAVSSSVFDDFEAKNSSRASRWDGWQKALPPWSVFSMRACPLAEPPFLGLTPHLVTYHTMGMPLVRELAQALRCFVHSLADETREGGDDFDERSCEGIRPLEMVMVDVALHTEELGVCAADSTLGLSAMDHVQRFFREPAVYCKGYGNMMGERQKQ